MKKFFRFSVAAAAAVLALVSCQRSELAQLFSGPKTKVTIGVRPEEAEEATRTYIEEDASTPGVYHSKWSNSGEKLAVIFGEPNNKPTFLELSADDTDDNNPIFYGEGTLKDSTYNLFVLYPRSAYEKCYADGTVGVTLKLLQHPVLGSFDPSCDLMGWSTDAATVENSSFTLEGISLQRVMAILRVNLNADAGSKAKGLVVTGFKMEVPKPEGATSDIILTGRAGINAQGEIPKWTVTNNYVEASVNPTELITIGEGDGFNALYLVVNAATIPEGASINFSIETEEYSGINKITRTVAVPAGGIELEAGKVNTINLKIRDKDFPGEVVVEDYEGEWLMAGVRDDVTFAAVAYSSGNNLAATAPLSFSADGSTITSTTDLNTCKMTFTKITEEGDYKGMYTIQDANGKYLYAASSSANQLKAKDAADVNAYWTVTIDAEGGYSIIASKSSNRNVMQFNPNTQNANAIIGCYSSTNTDRQQVKLYSWSMVDVEPTPIENPTISTILADQTISATNAVNYEIDGVTVMAAQGGKNYVLGDDTGVILMYVSKDLTVGSQYKVKGDVKLYNGVHEFTNSPTVTASTGTAPAYGTPEAMTESSLTAYADAPVTKYVVITATAGDSGYTCTVGSNTINVYDGTGTWSTFYGKEVKITGYLTGYKTSNSQIQMIATALEDSSVTAPVITFAETTKEITSAATSVVFSYTKNSYVTELPSWSFYSGSGCVDGEVTVTDSAITVPVSANTSSAPRFIYIDVTGQGIDGTVQLCIKQAGYNPVSISTILADNTVTASNTVNYDVDGVTVMAAQGNKNYIIGDATGVMLMYYNGALTVGNQYRVDGGVKLYNGVHEFSAPTVTASTGTAPAYGTPEAMTESSLTAYANAPVTKYAVLTAAVGTSGYLCTVGANTVNVYDGTGTWSQFYGKTVKVTGYLIGYYNSKINMIATAIEEDSSTPTLSVSPESLSWGATEYGSGSAKTVTVTLNGSAAPDDYYYEGSDTGWTISDDQNGTITVYPNAANAGTAAKTFAFVVKHSDDESIAKTVTCTQSAPSSGGDPVLKYTLDGTVTGGSNGYATESDITQSSISWKVMANTTMSPWRFGGKSLTNENRAAYSTAAITSDISSIEVESGSATATVNSLTISVHGSAADAASGSNAIATKTVTSGITGAKVTLTKTDATSWAGKYYRIVYNVTCGSSNQYVQLKSAKFYGN